jgi:hypothetical protein
MIVGLVDNIRDTMKDIIYFVIGAGILVGVLSMLREKTARRIRNSRYWFVGWLGYLLGLSFAANLMMPVLNHFPIDDDIAVPLIAFSAMLIATAMLCVQMYRLRRQIRKG